jgi:hypothetical protein
MRRSPRTSLMALLVAVLAIAAAGCGGSEVASDEVPGAPPAITVPTDSDLGGGGGDGNNSADNADSGAEENDSSTEDGAADPGTAEPEATAEPPAETGGGTAAPEATAAPDTATNDTQPEPGSPPEQFEDFCEQNAGAC